MSNCDECRKILFNNNIFNKKDFLKWSLKGGHPDKGGDYRLFQEVSSCNDDFFGLNRKCSGEIHNLPTYNAYEEYLRRKEKRRQEREVAKSKDPYYVNKKNRMEKEKIERMNSVKKAKSDKKECKKTCDNNYKENMKELKEKHKQFVREEKELDKKEREERKEREGNKKRTFKRRNAKRNRRRSIR